MSGISRRASLGRIVWTVLVTAYFLVFFRNLLQDALATGNALPTFFAVVFVLWLAVEYYFGSPFFQSGVVSHSAFWRGVFAFFVYPFFGYCAADFIWWHWTQIPVPPVVSGVLGIVVFGAGAYVRIATLLGIVRILDVRQTRAGKGKVTTETAMPEKPFLGLSFQRLCRHPRYFATFVQLLGAALAFRSWGGVVLAAAVGLPLVWVQARYEDRELRATLKAEFDTYRRAVPLLWPRLRS